jgi:hypothetical protein
MSLNVIEHGQLNFNFDNIMLSLDCLEQQSEHISNIHFLFFGLLQIKQKLRNDGLLFLNIGKITGWINLCNIALSKKG